MTLKLVFTFTGSITKNGRKKLPKIRIMLTAPPRAVFADEIPEGFLRHVGVPDDEILRELGVGGKHGEGKEQHADEIKIILLQHARQDALPLQNGGDDIDRRQRDPRTVRRRNKRRRSRRTHWYCTDCIQNTDAPVMVAANATMPQPE